ncbi:hypothetical protein RRG08_054243 [Elysia crispata]|uniref:Uncharacterized protein n=1 Tax=Elysia crispata TaxID=231223 RepID=A0AAE1CVW7_9GAST|nr:hypothetical protein RRG08_054243 [Elysia crispata]
MAPIGTTEVDPPSGGVSEIRFVDGQNISGNTGTHACHTETSYDSQLMNTRSVNKSTQTYTLYLKHYPYINYSHHEAMFSSTETVATTAGDQGLASSNDAVLA